MNLSADQSRSSDDEDDGVPIRPHTTEGVTNGPSVLLPVIPTIKKRKAVTTDFKKIALIGRGNIGRVYLAQKKGTKEFYSLKVIGKKLVTQNKQRHIESEKGILERLKHPFIVHLEWDFETPFYYIFVMTYCAGGDFWRLLNKQPGNCFREVVAKFYLAEIICALEYLHMEGVVYRDLKPENILLHESGHIMLSDFDLSKHSDVEDHARIKSSLFGEDEVVVEPSNFRSNSFVGTDEYLAPEIIAKDGHSASVDWWTLGVLMYEFLYGCNPFAASSIQETYSKIQKGEFTFPKMHRYKVSKDAKDLIKELLDVDSEDRLGSKYGASEIKQHDFFSNIKFALIRNMTPPIIPRLNGRRDTSYFYQYKPYDDDVPDDWGYTTEQSIELNTTEFRSLQQDEIKTQ
ncbi:serine/threonine protein kinase ppk22, putative [Entamoeba dispar SAW760]|uniref:non-specific serine/threonine protein kinase n=1 Tax=Entamoeba dispar (strain ATCC PRA-260 / SAW760) TaxID=370354 RepID=B0E6L7_ENTDS|nr:serine/threonine protein kinase ppk22, putative [Entamoeba dispar SAW760]EDR29850.1 serine/threonine protein kinase ppk22, putative [Entamoeba dispar SAW760]|eukprot:EDR29850.1 serine/threonine protein kinase ppk22, putative [Entamoeba dispar SAW760]